MGGFSDQFKTGQAATAATAPAPGSSWLPEWATKDWAEPVRRALDSYVPDLDLRARDLEEQIVQLRQGEVPGFSEQFKTGSTPKEQAQQLISLGLDSGRLSQNYATGFVSSALSSLPEFFGMPTPVESEVFRIQNPWMGFASEMLGPGGAYAAAFKVSKVGKFASALETGTARGAGFFGATSEAANPIIWGGMRELLRYTPLELSRIGVGLTVWPDNADNLFADVAMGSALNYGLGAGGGLIRSAGQSSLAKKVRGLINKDIGLLPTFELRLMKAPEARFEEGADSAGLIKEWTGKVLSARPGQRTKGQDASVAADKPFWQLDDVNEQGQGLLNRLFKVNSSTAKPKEIVDSGLDVRLLATGSKKEMHKVPKEIQQEVLKTFGMKDASDLASAFVYPRMVKLTTPRMAGTFSADLEKAGSGLKWFDEEEVLLAQDGAGLWVFGKRIGRTEAAKMGLKRPPKKQGKLQSAKGDFWLFGKTDRLDLLLPKRHEKFSRVVEDWAQMNVRFRPGLSDDPFSQWMDMALSSMNPADWAALKRGTRASGVARIASRVKQKAMTTAGLVDSAGLKNAAEHIYDVFVPTARKEVSDPIYQRLWGLMKGVTQYADEVAGKILRGTPRFQGSPTAAIRNSKNVSYQSLWHDLDSVENLVGSLDQSELNLIANATQSPGSEMAAALEQLAENGLVSENAKRVIAQLQEINKRMLDEFVRPAMKVAGMGDDTEWLAGYIMPRLYRGEHYVDVMQGGKIVYRVSGKTGQETQTIAKSIVEEAAEKGQTYTTGELKQFNTLDAGPDYTLDTIMEAAAPVGSTSQQVQEIVLGGIKRAMAGRQGIPKVKSLGTLKERSDLNVAGYDWTHEEVVRAIANHNRQLLRFAGMKVWQKRWYQELASWGEAGNKVLQQDLERKAAQLQGIELGLSRAQNEGVRQLFGVASSKPFTKGAAFANSLMYNMMLGLFNLNFAVLNVVTPLMTTLPWVSFMQRAPSYKQLQFMQVLPKMTADGRPGGIVGTLDTVKTFGQGLKVLAKPSAEDKALMERAMGDGVLDAQLYENFVGGPSSRLGAGLRESWNTGGGWEFIKALANAPATKSEQFSRLTAFSVSLALGRDFFGLADDALYRFAKKSTEQSMYGYGLTDRARIMTGPVGSMVGLFKNWQFHYINQMAEYAGVAVKDGVYAPAFWMLGMTGAVGGLGALPIKSAVDGFVNMATNGEQETAFQWLMANWGEEHPKIADTVYFGLPAMIGASLQSSAVMPGTDIVQDATNLANVVTLQRAIQLGTIVGKMQDFSQSSGQNPLTNDNLRAEFLGAVLPRSAARIYSTTEENAIISMRTGYPLKQDVSPTTKLLYGLGFNQTEIERYSVAGRELFKRDEERNTLLRNFGLEYSDAMREGDYKTMRRVIDKAVMLGIPLDSVMRSAQTRGERFEGDALSRYDQGLVQEYGLD